MSQIQPAKAKKTKKRQSAKAVKKKVQKANSPYNLIYVHSTFILNTEKKWNLRIIILNSLHKMLNCQSKST